MESYVWKNKKKNCTSIMSWLLDLKAPVLVYQRKTAKKKKVLLSKSHIDILTLS